MSLYKTNIKMFCFVIVLQSIVLFSKAQNLVQNPSFEQHTQCPTAMGDINMCNNWNNASINSTCDYYSALNCSGDYAPPLINIGMTFYQEPLSGYSFGGFIPYYGVPGGMPSYVEFIQGQFNAPLIAGEEYYVEFYINLATHQKYAIHNVAALITDTSGYIDYNNLSMYSPQILPLAGKIYEDTVNWERISGYYMAHGGESYITIGNYTPYGQELKDSTNDYLTAETYYFIDSVGVYEVTHWDIWNAGGDKIHKLRR